MRHTIVCLATTAILSCVVAGAHAQSNGAKDLTVEQSTVAGAGTSHPGDPKVSVTSDRNEGTYAAGEAPRLTIDANQPAYVTVFDVGPSGQTVQLFPNRYQPDNLVQPGKPTEIGGGVARLTVSAPFGTELIKVVASDKPLTVLAPETQASGDEAFLVVGGGATTLSRNLQVATTPAANDVTRKISISSLLLHTAQTRPARAESPVVVVIAPPPSPTTSSGAALVTLPDAHAFPLLVAADRPSYAPGDVVTLAVTSTKACHLTVLDVSGEAAPKLLYPNATVQDDAIGAMRTVFVSGGDSRVTTKAEGPQGTDRIVAICSTDAIPGLVDAASDRVAFARNLSMTGARPEGTVSTATTTFSVKP